MSPFLRIKYLILAAFLTMSFVNNGIVIRNYKHVSWIIAAPCRDGSAAESKGVHMHEQKVREISCHLLKRASLHWNIGNELYYNIYKCQGKHLSEQKIKLGDRDQYRLFEMFYKREVIKRIITYICLTGLRCFYFAIQTAAWALDPTAVIIVTVVLIILLIFTDHPF